MREVILWRHRNGKKQAHASMKKVSRQSHPAKSVAMKQDTSQAEIDGKILGSYPCLYLLLNTLINEGDPNNIQLTGVFCEDFSIICDREGLIKIPLVVYTPKLQCGASVDDHSSLGSRIHVTLEDDDPNSVKHIHLRNMRLNYKLTYALHESSKECSTIQSLSLWNTGDPFSNIEATVLLVQWMHTHNTQHLSVGATNIPVTNSLFDDLIGSKTDLTSVYDCTVFE